MVDIRRMQSNDVENTQRPNKVVGTVSDGFDDRHKVVSISTISAASLATGVPDYGFQYQSASSSRSSRRVGGRSGGCTTTQPIAMPISARRNAGASLVDAITRHRTH